MAASAVAAATLGACQKPGASQKASASLSGPIAAPTPTTTLPPTTTVPPTTTLPPTTTSLPRPTTTTLPRPTTTTIPGPVYPHYGSSGPDVLLLQQQLTSLGYWLGTPNGTFGLTTEEAVWALQKVAGLPRTGTWTPATAAAVGTAAKPTPQSPPGSGHVIEVNLTLDILMIVDNGQVTDTLNVSTGGHYVYYEHGQRAVAITPTGHFTTYREVNGTDVSPLGTLWRPKFFVGGYAIHGDSYVPATPVSHGCVRVTDAAIDWIWANNLDPLGTSVWVY